MTKRKMPTTKLSAREVMQGKQYPGIKGKVVQWADHTFEEGILYIRIRFTDNTELCWRISSTVLLEEALYPILDRLGIPRKKGASGFHTFRHSAASIVNEQTGNLKLAQKFLGHSTIKMTADIYTHTSAEAERDAAIALERAIYGDLFPVVPNIENRNNFAALN